MDALSNPFDDPEFQAAMKRAGVVHKPGMAAELMKELAPLLAADGIDLDDEHADFDPERLNSAMDRAVERHNLALFTPVGQDRAQACEVLVEFASALAGGGQAAAELILESIKPEKTAGRPAASHMIGAGLGLIDTWFASSEYAPLLARGRVQKWRGQAKRIATDLRVLGASGRAFEAHSSIILKYGGELLMHGTMLLVGSAVRAVSEQEGVSAEVAFERLNQGASDGAMRGSPGPVSLSTTRAAFSGSAFSGSAFGLGADGQLPRPEATPDQQGYGDELFLDAFEESLDGLPDSQIDLMLSILQGLDHLAHSVGLNLHSPEDCATVIEMIAEFTDTRAREEALDVLHDYVHHRMKEDMFPEDWDDTHALLESVHLAEDPIFPLLQDAIDDASALPPEEIQRALARVRPVAAVRELLDWMGNSKPVTGTGGLRRADIGTVAAMIGIHAEGAARLPWGKYWEKLDGTASQEPDPSVAEKPEIIQAQTMWAVPKLATWWGALQAADAIEVTASRVRPGSGISQDSGGWADAYAPEILCSVLVAESLMEGLQANDDFRGGYSMRIVEEAILRAVEVLGEGGYQVEDYTPEELSPEESAKPDVQWAIAREQIFENSVNRRIRTLLDFHLLESRDGALVAPRELRGVVARGILMAFDDFVSATTGIDDGLDRD